MHLAEITERQMQLLGRFIEIGGCVDYVVFDCEADEDVVSEAVHRQAAIKGLEELQRKWEEYALSSSKQDGYSLDQYFRLTIDHDKAEQISGVRISTEVFLGNRYDFARQGLLLLGRRNSYLNSHFFYLDDETEENIVPLRMIPCPRDSDNLFVGSGYAYAFSDPPYTLWDTKAEMRPKQEAGELFEAINEEVLGGVRDDSIIFDWPRGWSNYFDAGEEWWGAFLWTFASPDTNRIVMIGASTTD